MDITLANRKERTYNGIRYGQTVRVDETLAPEYIAAGFDQVRSDEAVPESDILPAQEPNPIDMPPDIPPQEIAPTESENLPPQEPENPPENPPDLERTEEPLPTE